MAKAYVVLTAVGPDRVGIVDDISGSVTAAACNIEESKMAVLGGEFAVIMLVSGASARVDSLVRSLPAVSALVIVVVGVAMTVRALPGVH